MAQDVQGATPATPVSSADVANANALVESISTVRKALSDASTASVAVLNSIATAITQKLVGGVVGTTANALLRAKTASSGSSAGSIQGTTITVDDTGDMQFPTGVGIRTAQSAGNTLLLQAYNTNTAAYVTQATLTANNPPTFDLAATSTIGGVGIASLNTNTWAQQQGFALATLTDATTVSWDGQTQQTAKVTLGGNRTLGAMSNPVAGFTYVLIVIQDGTGSRTLAYNAVYKFPSGTAPVLSTAAGAVDVLTFVCQDSTHILGVIQKAFS